MKPALQLKIGQSLTMTPQLQQAIRLLQLSSLELHSEIQDLLDSNMMLELDEHEDEEPVREAAPGDRDNEELDFKQAPEQNTFPEELPVDTVWDDIYDSNTLASPGLAAEAAAHKSLENRGKHGQSLREHLHWQLNFIPMTETDKALALAIIDALDNDGYLTCSLEDIHASLGAGLEVAADEILATLHLVQALEPVGVAARDLQECLHLQLAQCPADLPWLKEAQELVDKHLQLLASHNYHQLERRMKLTRAQLQEVIALIQSMQPRPGAQVYDSQIQYIVPDVYVKKHKGAWKVALNQETIPQLRINASYAGMIRRADNSADNHSMKTHLQEARWFIKSLQGRSETLLRVASAIVERQRAFLDYGEEAMQPLVMHAVAETLDLHESTISRVTTRKYMHTPRGIFELKYFFSSHVGTDFGGACSSTAIRALIKKLIAAERSQRPLSDSKITALLAAQGIQVARRTVAKYRETLGIPPSNERKRLI